MSELERVYTVPLGKAYAAQRWRRSEKAVMILREFAKRHMKAEEVAVDPSVNELVWAKGIKSPPRKIRVKMTRDSDGKVTISLLEAPSTEESKEEKAEKKTEKLEEKPEPKEEAKAEPEEPIEEPEAATVSEEEEAEEKEEATEEEKTP
jgi:large subunit ribosomal protein L31e